MVTWLMSSYSRATEHTNILHKSLFTSRDVNRASSVKAKAAKPRSRSYTWNAKAKAIQGQDQGQG